MPAVLIIIIFSRLHLKYSIPSLKNVNYSLNTTGILLCHLPLSTQYSTVLQFIYTVNKTWCYKYSFLIHTSSVVTGAFTMMDLFFLTLKNNMYLKVQLIFSLCFSSLNIKNYIGLRDVTGTKDNHITRKLIPK